MRLPRVRITVGSLLFAVAIVALNCWVYRAVETWEHYEPGDPSLWRLDPDVILFLLPLANVAAIGSWLTLRKWIRAGQTGLTVSHPSAITFFCLNFLVIGYLALNFQEDRVGQILRPCFSGFRAVLEGLKARTGWKIPEGQVDSVFEIVLISGPLLLLAGLGGWIARRAALKLSKRRFLVMTGLVSLGFVMLGLAILLVPQPFGDQRSFELVFRMIDKDSGQPIDRASVRIANAFREDAGLLESRSEPATALSDRDGLTRLNLKLTAHGERNAFQTIGAFTTWGNWLEASAEGHQTLRIPLPYVLGPDVEMDRTRPQDVVLARGHTPQDSFNDLAGSFADYHMFGGRGIVILPDGRFKFRASGCTFVDEQYGFIERVGDEIALVAVPKPGEPPDDWMSMRYRMIQWGECHYLTSTESYNIRDFCKAALIPERKRKPGKGYGGLLRESDSEKIPRGLPPLPLSAWVEFVLFETDFRNQDSDVRQALESFVKQNFWPESREARRNREEKFLAQLLQAPEVVKAP